MFEYIQNRQTTQILKNLEKACDTLPKASASDIQKSWYYQGFLTEKQKQKSLDEQKKIIFKKLQKQSDKEILKLAKKLEEVAAAPEFLGAVVSVEWKASRTWGKNPTATAKIKTANGITVVTGSPVSGCGFDKLSEAIARTLNASDAIKKVLYKKFEEVLQTNPAANLCEVLGYGSGYELPELEGGCGLSTFREIFKNCGFVFEEVTSGSNFNVFEVRAC